MIKLQPPNNNTDIHTHKTRGCKLVEKVGNYNAPKTSKNRPAGAHNSPKENVLLNALPSQIKRLLKQALFSGAVDWSVSGCHFCILSSNTSFMDRFDRSIKILERYLQPNVYHKRWIKKATARDMTNSRMCDSKGYKILEMAILDVLTLSKTRKC